MKTGQADGTREGPPPQPAPLGRSRPALRRRCLHLRVRPTPTPPGMPRRRNRAPHAPPSAPRRRAARQHQPVPLAAITVGTCRATCRARCRLAGRPASQLKQRQLRPFIRRLRCWLNPLREGGRAAGAAASPRRLKPLLAPPPHRAILEPGARALRAPPLNASHLILTQAQLLV